MHQIWQLPVDHKAVIGQPVVVWKQGSIPLYSQLHPYYLQMTVHQVVHILLIGDDEGSNPFPEEILRAAMPHARLRLVADGKQAIDLLNAAHNLPDAILLNSSLCETDSKLVIQLKQSALRRHIPVIMLTNSTDILGQQQARQLGIIRFLTRPVSPDELGTLVEWVRLNQISALN